MPQTSGFWIQYIKDESGSCQGQNMWKGDVDYIVNIVMRHLLVDGLLDMCLVATEKRRKNCCEIFLENFRGKNVFAALFLDMWGSKGK